MDMAYFQGWKSRKAEGKSTCIWLIYNPRGPGAIYIVTGLGAEERRSEGEVSGAQEGAQNRADQKEKGLFRKLAFKLLRRRK